MLRFVRADYDIMLIAIIACSYTNLPQFAFALQHPCGVA